MQRRHQKVVEEAPAPASPKRCASLSASAACACLEIVYRGAGNLRVLYENGRVLFHRDEHPYPGGASRSPRWSPASTSSRSSCALPPVSPCRSPSRTSASVATPSSAGSTPKIRPPSCPLPVSSSASHAPGGLGVRWESHIYGYKVPLLRLHDRQADPLRENRDVAIARMRHPSTSWWWKGSRPTSPCKRDHEGRNFQHGGTNIHYLQRSWVCNGRELAH